HRAQVPVREDEEKQRQGGREDGERNEDGDPRESCAPRKGPEPLVSVRAEHRVGLPKHPDRDPERDRAKEPADRVAWVPAGDEAADRSVSKHRKTEQECESTLGGQMNDGLCRTGGELGDLGGRQIYPETAGDCRG